MGLPAYLVASSLIAVQAQRLVRKLCDCKALQPDGTAKPKGCDACRGSGFRGRLAIYELLRVTPRVRSVLLAHASDDIVRNAARVSGMKSMYADGMGKVSRGLTTAEEVLRVVPPDEPDHETEPEVAVEEPPRAPIPAPLSRQAASARRSRILVVEDDRSMLEALQDTLEREDYEVTTAVDGVEARKRLYELTPDVILTDLHMPAMDGLELLERIRGNLSTRHIPVVFLSGIESVDAQIQAYNLGADDYVSKPVSEKLLLSRIRRALLRAHLMQVG
jgi:CheY-like chemotaxis protein